MSEKTEVYAEDEINNLLSQLEDYIPKGYWCNTKYIFHPELEHPCNQLDYCPYGQLVECYPLRGWEKDARKTAKAEGMKFRDYMKAHPEIDARDCGVFGHECPVHYLAETETDLK